MKRNFIVCGVIGWCLEIIWTGLSSLFAGEPKMIGHSSILMFPIYGCAAVIGPISHKLKHTFVLLRGCIYAFLIFAGEFISGYLLRLFNLCPWDYSHTSWNFHGLIRLDYLPVWFFTGLLYEKLLSFLDSKR